jgi:hypothetical protein
MQVNYVEVLVYTGNERPEGGSKGLQAKLVIRDKESSKGVLEWGAGLKREKGNLLVPVEVADWHEELLSQVRQGWEMLDEHWPEDGSWEEKLEAIDGPDFDELEFVESSSDDEVGVLYLLARISELFEGLGAEVRLDEVKMFGHDDEKGVQAAAIELHGEDGGFRITIERTRT